MCAHVAKKIWLFCLAGVFFNVLLCRRLRAVH